MTISALPAWAHENTDDEALQSAGFVRSGVEVRILDADGAIAPHGEVGEIAVRGDVVMRGYWRNEDADAASLRDGWLRTGDIGRFDARGHLHILDRRHDTIISGGSNIYPREVEDVLTRHPAVSEAIVFGIPDVEWGESVASVIVLREECAGIDEDTLIAFCRDHFARSVQLSTLRRQILVEAELRGDRRGSLSVLGRLAARRLRLPLRFQLDGGDPVMPVARVYDLPGPKDGTLRRSPLRYGRANQSSRWSASRASPRRSRRRRSIRTRPARPSACSRAGSRCGCASSARP
jgi:acyl-CoA synthetase (AMP-forming)/AMP-acid ligase II